MHGPFANGDNGQTARDRCGRFGPGNKAAAARGNPHAARVNAWRGALAATVTERDLRAVVAQLVERAKAGERWAIIELLDRCLGKPAQQHGPADGSLPEPITLRFELAERPVE